MHRLRDFSFARGEVFGLREVAFWPHGSRFTTVATQRCADVYAHAGFKCEMQEGKFRSEPSDLRVRVVYALIEIRQGTLEVAAPFLLKSSARWCPTSSGSKATIIEVVILHLRRNRMRAVRFARLEVCEWSVRSQKLTVFRGLNPFHQRCARSRRLQVPPVVDSSSRVGLRV